MAKEPAQTLPGADNMPGADNKKSDDAKAASKDLVCYTGCSVNVGLGSDDDEGAQPDKVFLKAGETVNVAAQKKLGTKNVKNLVAMGRLVPADSDEARYIKDKVAKLKAQNTTEAKEGETR